MAINTNALTLGGSAPAQSSFQTRSAGSDVNSDPSAQSSTSGAGHNTASEPNGGNTSAQDGTAGASGQSGTGNSAGNAKSPGPSAQTRSGQSALARGKVRTRATVPGPTSQQARTDAPAATGAPATDFGTVLASALGRSATTATDPAGATQSGTENSDSTVTSESATQPTSATPTDAVAWLAQVLTPPAVAQTPAVAPAVDAATATSAGVTAAAAPSTGAGTPGTPALAALAAPPADPTAGTADASAQNDFSAQIAAQTAATAGQLSSKAVVATRVRANTDPVPQLQPAATTDAQTTADPGNGVLGNASQLADVQKLISGLTGSASGKSDSDTDSATAAPTTHAAGANDSSEAAQAAALQAASLTRTSGSAGTATLTIHAPVGSAAFTNEVGAKVTSLAQASITQAQLQLNPTDLGPVQVHITMQSGQASVWFGATHADTRAALEQSLPRLREMFAGAGMPLADSGVFREPPQQQQAQSLPGTSTSRAASSDAPTAPTVTQVSNIRLSLLDTYA